MELVETPFFLIILITTGMKPFMYNFQKTKGHLNLGNINQNNSTQIISSFHELRKRAWFFLEELCLP